MCVWIFVGPNGGQREMKSIEIVVCYLTSVCRDKDGAHDNRFPVGISITVHIIFRITCLS
jgi:hypothetical protein